MLMKSLFLLNRRTFNRAMITSRTVDTFECTDPNITPPISTFSDQFLSPFTQLDTPQEWKNRRHLRESKSGTTDAARIKELEAELFDLRQFVKAERHFGDGTKGVDGNTDQNSETDRLRRDLQVMEQKYKDEHYELLQFRAGLLQPDDNSPVKNSSCGHEELVTQNENLSAEMNLMEQINGALEEKTVELWVLIHNKYIYQFTA